MATKTIKPLQSLLPRAWVPLLLAVAIAFNAGVRLRLLDMPLERDEGEFAYSAQLLLDGRAPYNGAYNKKFPGVAAMYALAMLPLGQTAAAVRTGVLVANALAVIMLYLLARRLANATVACAAACVYAVLSIDVGVVGNAAHATQYISLFGLSGLLVLLGATEQNRLRLYVASGLLFGMAVLMKQHACFLAAGAVLYSAYCRRLAGDRLSSLMKITGALLAGTAVPIIAVVGCVLAGGTFEKFWLFTVTFATGYVTLVSFSDGLANFRQALSMVIGSHVLLWAAAGAGLVLLFCTAYPKRVKVFGAIWGSASFLCTVPALIFRTHYFIVLLPAVALCAGFAADGAASVLRKIFSGPGATAAALVLVFVLAGCGVYRERDYFFYNPPLELSRSIYGLNPFPEARVIADYINKHTAPEDTIAVLGSEAQVYFYANRRAATGYIYVCGLVDGHRYNLRMQQEMAREIEAARPKMLVFVTVHTSWLRAPGTERYIFDWFNAYRRKGYRLEGLADIYENTTIYRWGDEARRYRPEKSSYMVYVFERAGL